jgi:putative tricarboxylic transport membrane protein
MDLVLAAFAEIARLDVLVALFIGAIGGVLIGAIPGVGPAVAIAILLPATFQFEPIVGLTLLLGIYGASMFGGAIPAILINTPGTAVNALTTYDGYPMTQRGEAKRALSLAYSASFFGAIFSIICLAIFSPVLSHIAPLFGSRDIFMAAMLGVVCVILAHRNQTLIAAALLFFGMFLNVVGMEPVRYSKRFTFDQSWLNAGFDLIVVLLGLFALSQAYVLLSDKSKSATPPPMDKEKNSGLGEVMQHKRVASVSSAFGVVMGMIPGVGEFTAQFFSYTYAQKTSKNPELIGEGSPEGLVASEAANNAVPAAAMIPLLALGIPGEALTAMMLSVFYVHGVVPGPRLFESQPEFLLSLLMTLVAVNIVVIIFLSFASNLLVQVVRIPNRLIGVVVLTLSMVGVYALRNSLTDCMVAAAFGLLGFILKRVGWPVVPIVLGMVLGRIMEDKFRASMARVNSPLDFIDRPVSGVMFAIICAALTLHVVTLIRERKKPKPA